MSTQTRDEAMIKEKQEEGGQLLFLVPRASTQLPAPNSAAYTAPPPVADRIDRISDYRDYESRRARMDSFLNSETALLLSILLVVVLSGFAAYYFGP